MMRAFTYSSLVIYLLSILVNVALAEETALNNQKTGNALTSAVSSSAVLAVDKDAKSYHLPNMLIYYEKGRKHWWVYFDSEERNIDDGYSREEAGNGFKGLSSNQPSPTAVALNTNDDSRVESLQKNDVAVVQEGIFLKKEGDVLQLEKIDLSPQRPRRLEASYSFDYLDPNDLYGNWQAGQLSFYDTVTPDFTYFLQGVLYNRDEGTGAMGIVGAYIGWTSYLYTCTSMSAGTHQNYLPKIRFDHEFNFSVWPSKRINFPMGISYIDYFDDHSGWVFSGGPMISIEKLVLHYRLFYNISNPGTIASFSHLISLGYGQEGWLWTYLNVSFGKQAYLATFVVPQEVNQDSFSLNLRHRHWLDKYYGVFGDVSYTKLEDGYDKYGIGLGFFYTF